MESHAYWANALLRDLKRVEGVFAAPACNAIRVSGRSPTAALAIPMLQFRSLWFAATRKIKCVAMPAASRVSSVSWTNACQLAAPDVGQHQSACQGSSASMLTPQAPAATWVKDSVELAVLAAAVTAPASTISVRPEDLLPAGHLSAPAGRHVWGRGHLLCAAELAVRLVAELAAPTANCAAVVFAMLRAVLHAAHWCAPQAGNVQIEQNSAALPILLSAVATAALLEACATGTSVYHEPLCVVHTCAPHPSAVLGSRQQQGPAASLIGWIAMACAVALASSASATDAPLSCNQEDSDSEARTAVH
eukprot:gene12032-biopygen13936